MVKVGITGQSGFIGTHLYNYLGTKDITRIPFKREYFYNGKLDDFVKSCDVIVHLAAINRNNDQNSLYQTNIELIVKLQDAINKAKSKPHIIFASSTQENQDNAYGKSKKDGRKLFEKYSKFTNLLIPNIFGTFCKPNYNSFVATFCHNLTHDKKPKIHIDKKVELIYIDELVRNIYEIMIDKKKSNKTYGFLSYKKRVSDILIILQRFKSHYFDQNIIPRLGNGFELNLFNTFRSYIKPRLFKLNLNKDERGYLVENIKEKTGGQSFYSITKPGFTRGNHFHIYKIERFCVIQGAGLIKIRKIGTDKIIEFKVTGKNPMTIDMPIWFTHNITNIGKTDMIALFWSNEFYDSENPDTYYEKI